MRIENKFAVIGNEPFGLLDCNLETKKEILLFGTEKEYKDYCDKNGIALPVSQEDIIDVEAEETR